MQVQQSRVWLCEECDAVIPKQTLQPGEKAYCPNCHHKIAEKSRYSLHVPLAFSITGLLLLVPACFLPLIHMQMLARVTDHSIVSGVADFIHQGMWIPAVLISAGAIISPLIYLVISTILLASILQGSYNPRLRNMLLTFKHIRYWGMLEVYLLGIFITIIKLGDVARIYPGLGLVTLAGLIICQAMITLTVKPHLLWRHLELNHTKQMEQAIHDEK